MNYNEVLDPNEYRLYIRSKYGLLNSAANVCRDLLLNKRDFMNIKSYVDSRLSEESQNEFNIGCFPDDQKLNILLNKIPYEEFVQKLNKRDQFIFEKNNYDGSVHRKEYTSTLKNHNVLIPYNNLYGNTIAFIGRTILSDEKRKSLEIQKYKFTRFNKSLHLFGLNKALQYIKKSKSVIIVEGQLDCITCHDHGICNTVGLGGITLSKNQYAILRRYADTIYLLLDNDDKGQTAQDKIISKYANEKVRIIKLFLPSGCKDIDQYLRTYGIPDWESLINLLKERHD